LFKSGWITVSIDGDLRGGGVEFAKIIRSEFDRNRSDVLFKTLQLGRAGNGNNPGFLTEEPGECDLSRCGIFFAAKAAIRSTKA
jgi:hypothetical protein